MKKLIAISVVFALAAGAAFAQISVSGEVQGSVTLGQGDSKEGSKNTVDGNFGRSRVEVSGQNEDGSFGGWIRFQAGNEGGGVGGNGLVWWKPIEQIKFQIGSNPDGHFGADGITRWGFYQVAGDVGVASEGWAFGNSFFGGQGAFGAYLFVTPIEGLEINLGIPISKGYPQDSYAKINAQVAYNISGIGKIALTYAGDMNDKLSVKSDYKGNKPDSSDTDTYPGGASDPGYVTDFGAFLSGLYSNANYASAGSNGSTMYLYFGLTAIENLGIDFGVGYKFPVKADAVEVAYKTASDKDASYVYAFPYDITVNAPVTIGLGVSFNAGGFGVKARFQAAFGGTIKFDVSGQDDYKLDSGIIFDVLPSYAFNDKVSVLLSAGMNINVPSDNDKDTYGEKGDPTVGWHVSPYVAVKGAGYWAPSFYAGIRIDSDGSKADDKLVVNWKIPIGMALGF